MAAQDNLYAKYSKKLEGLLDKVEPGLRQHFRGIEQISSKEAMVKIRDEMIAFAQPLAEVLCASTAQLAAAYFNTAYMLDSSWPEELSETADPPSPEVIEKDVRYAARYLFREEPDTEAFIKSCATQIERHGLATANKTVTQNCRKFKVKYARVPSSPHPCNFCLMLASRGFAYSTKESAGELNKFHNGCRCKIVPGFGDSPKLKGYDPDKLYEEWQIRRDGITSVLPKTSPELLRKSSDEVPNDVKEVNFHLYNSLKNMIERHGGLVLRGGEEVEKHLAGLECRGSSVGDVVFLTEHCTTSDALEEWYHFFQHKRGDYSNLDAKLCSVHREIDAKKFLLSVTERYKIPIEEVEQTKKHLASYSRQLEQLESEGR